MHKRMIGNGAFAWPQELFLTTCYQKKVATTMEAPCGPHKAKPYRPGVGMWVASRHPSSAELKGQSAVSGAVLSLWITIARED